MILFLYGVDTFRSRQQLRKMRDKFIADRDPHGLNVVRLDAEKDQPGKILEQLFATPFLAERRMVLLENALAQNKPDLQEALLKTIEEKTIPESTVVVFWESGKTFKTKLGKTLLDRLQKEKYAQEFEELKGPKLEGWIAAEIEARGGKIDRQALAFLTQSTSGDMWRISTLIDQLIAYTKRSITLADVQLFIDEKADDNIFNLIDAVTAKQPKHVFAMIQEQYAQGQDASYILAMIIRQFRILLELRDLFEREEGMPSDTIAKKLGLHPFVVKKSLPIMKRYTLTELKNIYAELLDIDIQTKTGKAKQEELLDIFVGRLLVANF